jgi:hypothetical protein
MSPSNKIYWEEGRAKDLSVPRYFASLQSRMIRITEDYVDESKHLAVLTIYRILSRPTMYNNK